MEKYQKLCSRMRNWDLHRMMYEKKIFMPRPGFELLMKYNPWAHHLSLQEVPLKGQQTEQFRRMMQVLYSRYPELKFYPKPQPDITDAMYIERNPIVRFIEKQREFISKGYTENKAFEMVEESMAHTFEKLRDNMRIAHGLAMNNHAQQQAEYEGRLKLMKMQQDLPKYIRNKEIQNIDPARLQLTREQAQQVEQPIDHYEPLLYEIVHDYEELREKKFTPVSQGRIQAEFIKRAQKLLNLHRERAHLRDGLANLTHAEIFKRIKESPTRIKSQAQVLLSYLKKHGVELDADGEVDLKKVKIKAVYDLLEQNKSIVKVTLLRADLHFEYPHLLEHKLNKDLILNEIDQEIAQIRKVDEEEILAQIRTRDFTYEDYFGLYIQYEYKIYVAKKDTKYTSREMAGEPTYQEFKDQYLSQDLFDRDLAKQQYKFWETLEEREKRLKVLWLEMKRDKILENIGIDEQVGVQKELVKSFRKLRFSIDQQLTEASLHPIFMSHYHTFTAEEFLADSKVQFKKIKELLKYSPQQLKEHPLIGLEYFKILSLIRRKYLLERSRRAFGEEYDMDYHYGVEDMTDDLALQREGKVRYMEGVSEQKQPEIMDDDDDILKGKEDFFEDEDEEEQAREDREKTFLQNFQSQRKLAMKEKRPRQEKSIKRRSKSLSAKRRLKK